MCIRLAQVMNTGPAMVVVYRSDQVRKETTCGPQVERRGGSLLEQKCDAYILHKLHTFPALIYLCGVYFMYKEIGKENIQLQCKNT